MKKRLVIITILIGIFLLHGCKRSNDDNQLRIAYFANITHAQALIMSSTEMLQEKLGDSYDVSWKLFNAGPSVIEALFAGEIDIAYIGPVPAINAYLKSKGDIYIIAGVSNGGSVFVSREDLSIHSIHDLSGKTVAVPQFGNTQHILLLHLLSQANLKPKTNGGTVNILAVSNADVEVLIDRGEVDAALVPEPWGSLMERNINTKLVLEYNEIMNDGNYATAVVIVSKDFMEKNDEIVSKFLEVHCDVTKFINENPEDAKIIINTQIEAITSKKLSEEILNKAFSRIKITEKLSIDSISQYAALCKEEGMVDKIPDENIIDLSILERINQYGTENR